MTDERNSPTAIEISSETSSEISSAVRPSRTPETTQTPETTTDSVRPGAFFSAPPSASSSVAEAGRPERSGLERASLESLLPEDPTGFRVWWNERNSFAVCSLHYHADPRKRDPSWRDEAKKGMPISDWDREYELNWETHSGRAVYGADFNEGLHVARKPIEIVPGLPVLRGWDFGLTPACVVLQLVGRRVNVLFELLGENLGAARFLPQVRAQQGLLYSTYEVFDFVDPAGFNRSESEEVSCVDIMVRAGLRPVAGEMTYEKRLGAVISLLTTLEGGRPLLVVSPRCPVVIAGFKGGYQYPDPGTRKAVIRMDRPLKNAFSHPHDALQYPCSKLAMVQGMMGRGRVRMRAPEYGFQGGPG